MPHTLFAARYAFVLGYIMQTFFSVAQIIISLGLIAMILIQERASGIGGAFGGGSEVYQTRRGFEKVILWATIIFAILFALLGIVNLLV